MYTCSSSSSSSSSSSRNEYYLGGIIALLLQYHRTMSIKSVCSSQMVTGQHWATDADKAQYIVRSHQGMTTGTERSSVLGGRRKEKVQTVGGRNRCLHYYITLEIC